MGYFFFFFFSSRRRHTRWTGDWSSDVCSSDLGHHLPVVHADQADLLGHPAAGLAQGIGHAAGDLVAAAEDPVEDRKSTRLNSSHPSISYAVFCLKKKKKKKHYINHIYTSASIK